MIKGAIEGAFCILKEVLVRSFEVILQFVL